MNNNYSKETLEFAKSIIISHLPTDRIHSIHQKDLKMWTGYNTRFIRTVIQKLRDDGYPICSTTHEGYWISSNAIELTETINQLKCQRDTLDETIKSLTSTLVNM